MLDWTDVVGQQTIDDGGYVGDLLKVARAHIDASVASNRLTQNQAGQVYATMVDSAIKTGVQYAIEKENLRLSKVPSTLNKG